MLNYIIIINKNFSLKIGKTYDTFYIMGDYDKENYNIKYVKILE